MKMLSKLKKYSIPQLVLAAIALAICALTAVFAVYHLIEHLICELQLSYTWDAPMYWTVGKGMLSGLKPYQDLYENKPPMVFFVSALSFAITGDVYLCNVFCFLCLVIIALSPAVCAIIFITRTKPILPAAVGYITLALGAGALLCIYAQVRSGAFQIEAMGSAFVILYLIFAYTTKSDKLKLWSPSLILASIALMVGVMFKEPFAVIAAFSALGAIKNKRDLLYKLIVPFVYGGVAGVALMAVTGTLSPYLTIYLPHMLSSHITLYGSPFKRALQIDKLINDMSGCSKWLSVLTVVGFFSVMVLTAVKYLLNKKYIAAAVSVILQMLSLYAVSFCVGLGGQYYNHHYIFALPYYFSIFISLAAFAAEKSEIKTTLREVASKVLNIMQKYALTAFIWLFSIFLTVGLIALPHYEYSEKVLESNALIRAQAEYVDDVLDAYGVDEYLWLGFNGERFYPFTEHLPIGPVCFQDPNNFMTADTWFAQKLLEQLDRAQIIIFSHNYCNAIADDVNKILKTEFTTATPASVAEVPRNVDFPYRIYYRKG